jgi:phage N-6-adenine-methyltransferase
MTAMADAISTAPPPQNTFSRVREKAAANRTARQRENNDWHTPSEIIELARAVLGNFDLDPASCASANERVKAAKFYSPEDDGLKQPWCGKVWMNPPYSTPEIGQFIGKLVAEVAAGRVSEAVVLVDNKTETAWYQAAAKAATAICLYSKRIRFLCPDGSPGFLPVRGQVLFYFGPNARRFIEIFEPLGLISAQVKNGEAEQPAETRTRLIAGDFEYRAPTREHGLEVVSFYAIDLSTGESWYLKAEDFGNWPPFPTDESTTFIAFAADADLRCFATLGWKAPKKIVCFRGAFRCATADIEEPDYS